MGLSTAAVEVKGLHWAASKGPLESLLGLAAGRRPCLQPVPGPPDTPLALLQARPDATAQARNHARASNLGAWPRGRFPAR
jgi:hypothetical protein